MEKVLQVGLGEQTGIFGKVASFGLAFENCKSDKTLANITMSGYVITAAAKARKMVHAGQLGSKPIKPEQVVLALMPVKEETVEQPHKSKPGVMVKYQVRHCPRKDSCKDVCLGQRGRIEFQDGT